MSTLLYLNKIKIRFKRSFIKTLAAQFKSKFYTRHEPALNPIRAHLFRMMFLKFKSNGCFGNKIAKDGVNSGSKRLWCVERKPCYLSNTDIPKIQGEKNQTKTKYI